MLLIIHNLPPNTEYSEVKELIISQCGLEYSILDNLQNEGCGMRVTVGVMSEEDAAILVRKINGFWYKGMQLYVEDKRNSQASEQPYYVNMQQPFHPMAQDHTGYYTAWQSMDMYQHPMSNIAMFTPGPAPQTMEIPYTSFGVQGQAMQTYMQQYGMVQFSQQGFIPHVQQQPSVDMNINRKESAGTSTGVKWEGKEVAQQGSPARARSSEGGSRLRGRVQDKAERCSPPRTHGRYSPKRNEKYDRRTSSSRRSPDASEERYKRARRRLSPNGHRDGFEPHVRISQNGYIRVRPKRVYSPKRNEKYDTTSTGTSSSRRSPDAREERHKRARRRFAPNAHRDGVEPHVRISKNGYRRVRPKRVSSPTGDDRSREKDAPKKQLEELTKNSEALAECKETSRQQHPVPVDTQVVAPPISAKWRNRQRLKIIFTAIRKIMLDIAIKLNMVEELANPSILKKQIRLTVLRQVMKIVANGDPPEPDEIFKLYRQQYTEKDDAYLLRDIKRTISEDPKDTPKVMEAKLKITKICQEAMKKELEHIGERAMEKELEHPAPVEQQCYSPRSIEEDNMYDNLSLNPLSPYLAEDLKPIVATPSGSREGSPPLVDAVALYDQTEQSQDQPELDIDHSTILHDMSSKVDKMGLLATMPLKSLKKVAKLVSTAVEARESTVTRKKKDLISRGHGYIREIAVKEEIPTAVHGNNIVSDLTVTKIKRCRTYSNSIPVENILEAVVSETLGKIPDAGNTVEANTHTQIGHKSHEETSVYNEVSSSGIVDTDYVEINTADQRYRNINSSRSKRALEDFAPALSEVQSSWCHPKDKLRLGSEELLTEKLNTKTLDAESNFRWEQEVSDSREKEHKFQQDHYKDEITEYNLRTDVYGHNLKDDKNLKGDSKHHPAGYEYRQEDSKHVLIQFPQKQCGERQIDYKDRQDGYIRSQEYKNLPDIYMSYDRDIHTVRPDDKDLGEHQKIFQVDSKGEQKKYDGRCSDYIDRKEHCKGLQEDKDLKRYKERTDSDKHRLDDNKRWQTAHKYRQLDHKAEQDRHNSAENSLVSHGSKRRQDDYKEPKENYKHRIGRKSPVQALKSRQEDHRDRLFNHKYREDKYLYRKREKSPISSTRSARFERKEPVMSASSDRYIKAKLTPNAIGGAAKSCYEPGNTQIASGTSSELKLPDESIHPPIKYWNAELESLRNESRSLYEIATNTQKKEDYEKYKSARRLYRSRLRPYVRKSRKELKREGNQHEFELTEQSDEDEDFLKALQELE